MESAKQRLYCLLIHHGFVTLRCHQSFAAYGSWWWLIRHRRGVFREGYALANLLHNIHYTILQPEFTEADIGFINEAIPVYIRQVEGEIDTRLVGLLLAFYDAVPSTLRERLTWHPSEDLRALSRPPQDGVVDGGI